MATGQRRFEELPQADPNRVVDLADDHPAILQSTTMFETTIVHPGKTRERLLVSGHNSRKIGKVVTKGGWKGKPIYTLTLVERATCPSSCHMWRSCYGNAMPFARRNAPGPAFEAALEEEVAHKAREHRRGFVVRLHILGDFYSAEYVRLWRAMLELHPELHVYGYTAVGTSLEPEHIAIAEAIDDMNEAYPEQCCIRHSSEEPTPGGAVVIDRIPEDKIVEEGIVCPAEREATACCATCGLCWEPAARDKTIVFVRHGMGSNKTQRIADVASKVDADGMRQIRPINTISKLAMPVAGAPPTMLWVKPIDLHVDETYQRNLSRKSLALISKIIQNWNWAHFKCPIVVKDGDTGKPWVLDGQHTAIAAATHPDIELIPVMIVTAETLSDRARAFMGHNKDRIAVTPLQIHHTSVVAKDDEAIEIEAVCDASGVRILKAPPPRNIYAPGETIALGAIRWIVKKKGAAHAKLVLGALCASGRAPVRADEIKGLSFALSNVPRPIEQVIKMLTATPYDLIAREASDIASNSGLSATESMSAVLGRKLTAIVAATEREAVG